MSDPTVRHRLLLSLRSERAMGLRAVPAAELAVLEPPVEVPAVVPQRPVAAMAPRPAVAPASREAPVMAGALFGGDGGPAIGGPALSTDEKRQRLAVLDDTQVKGCVKCKLCETRTHTVFGEGDVDSAIFFVGEGPGENEDLTGRPFVGKAGQLLDKMIAGMGLGRDRVYIGNCVKCRPPGNRVPAPDEAATCMPYLTEQIVTVRPKVIVTLGLTAAKYMLGDNKLAMGKIRGNWYQWRGIRLMPTFHPAYILRAYTEANRKAVWDDLQLVMAEVGLKRPAKGT